MAAKYPHIEVKLTGGDGNAFNVIGKVRKAMRQNSVPADEINQFLSEATSGDYDNVLLTCMRWVEVY